MESQTTLGKDQNDGPKTRNLRVLFVCLGNICRSPMAEGLFAAQVKAANLEDHIDIDSCGTSGWHIGEAPDRRMQATARRKGVELLSRARQITLDDFSEFDYILPMDDSNLQDLRELQQQAPGATARLVKMRDFDPQAPGKDVPDPYFGGDRGFEEVYEMLERSTANFLEHLREKHSL